MDCNDGAEVVIYENDPASPEASEIWLSNTGTESEAQGHSEWHHDGFNLHKSSAASLSVGIYRFRIRNWNTASGYALAMGWKKPGDSVFSVIPYASLTAAPEYYPRCAIFHENRLFLAGSIQKPQTVYGSKSLNSESFEQGSEDDKGIEFQVAASQVDLINWLVSKDGLHIGTLSTEYIAKGTNGYLTPSDISVKPNTRYGSATVRPIVVDDSIYFVEKSENGLREYTYVLEKDKAVGINVDILAEDLFVDGIQEMAYQQGQLAAYSFGLDALNAPYSLNLIWVLTETGELKCLTRESLEKVYAWSEQSLGGTDVTVDSMAVRPGDGGDQIWFAVSRTINSATVRTIEYLDPTLLVDLAASFTNGGAIVSNTITLAHLPGETIRAVGVTISGSTLTWEVIQDETTGYDLTLDGSGVYTVAGDYASKYHLIIAGLNFESIVETLSFDSQFGKNMTTLGMKKRWIDLYISVLNSVGFKIARAEKLTNTQRLRGTSLVSDRQQFKMLGYDKSGAIRLTQDMPLPLTVRSIFGKMKVNTG
ncbi:MAG: hypothetical protein GY869_02920 [Planctomycetes bacterium]|nr:hypothetical protein [Planctomycetota bacterium]